MEHRPIWRVSLWDFGAANGLRGSRRRKRSATRLITNGFYYVSPPE